MSLTYLCMIWKKTKILNGKKKKKKNGRPPPKCKIEEIFFGGRATVFFWGGICYFFTRGFKRSECFGDAFSIIFERMASASVVEGRSSFFNDKLSVSYKKIV